MPQYNNSVENISKILALFTNTRPRWGGSEIARELGLPKTTAFNLTRTLEKIGFLILNEEFKKYELGPRIANLSTVMATNLELNQKGAGLVQELSSACGAMASVGIWGDNAVIVVYSGNPFNIPQLPNYQIGPRLVAYCSALGRAILAYKEKGEIKKYLERTNIIKLTPKTKTKQSEIIKELNETKARGFSIINEEMVPESSSFGAPIFDRSNRVAGAISIYGYTDYIFGPDKEKFINILCSKAIQISQNLGYTG